MNLLLRLIWTVLAALLWRKPLDPLATSVATFRVLPTDLDPNIHLTNGRYLSFMDLGRLDLIVRTGIWRVLLRHGWSPVLGSVSIRYRRSLAPFERFQLTSRLLCWDAKWLYLEHVFTASDGQVAAHAMTRGLFRGKTGGKAGSVPTADIMAAMGRDDVVSPPIPAELEAWMLAEQELASRARAA